MLRFFLSHFHGTYILQASSLPKMQGGKGADVLRYFKSLPTPQIR